LWADESRVVVTATDQGTGPADPLVGLMPTAASRTAGLGLWILHRTCDYVSMGRDDEGFTVRVSVGGS
jgi:anti-sigma regulatory factor (Ser/Thr protein kinase)